MFFETIALLSADFGHSRQRCQNTSAIRHRSDAFQRKRDPVDCTLQCPYALATALARHEVDRDVAYMRGDLKIDGDYVAYILRLHPLLESDEFVKTCQSLRDVTEF